VTGSRHRPAAGLRSYATLSLMPDRPQPTVTEHDAAPSRGASFARGLRLGIPILAGYLPVGIAYGVVSVTTGFTVFQTIACSALVIAGAGQFIAVQLMGAGVGAFGAILATGVVNLRYVLFSATLAPHLHETSRPMQVPLAFTLTDETFGVNITELREGKADDFSMLGVGAISWVGWTLGTVIGAVATSLVADPGQYGISFAMPAMFTALLVAQLTDKRFAVIGALAAALALALTPVLPAGWPVIAGALGAATVAAVIYR
jgi:4-azaleucine resistance transporter AzlC